MGSRDTPEDVMETQARLAHRLTDLRYRGRSGCAPGSDTAFWKGAQRSARYPQLPMENYLPNSWMFNRAEFGYIRPDPDNWIFDASSFHDNWDQANAIALQARGSWNGLGRGGIQLHTRNVYQVLGRQLDKPSKFLLCWAEPVGRKGLVRGGTNTAVQVALRYRVPIFNLYLDHVRKQLESWLESGEPDLCTWMQTHLGFTEG